ncbi:MAG: hypothetical protein VXW14_02400 [Candidatus Thermoplasmatota archaeon]|nr:hypothetical protein [Candidatus Thermoplasmatota archaeon]
MSEVDETQLNQLLVHKDAWNQKDLLEGVVQRYLTVRSHVGGLWPTWEVESDALEEKLAELNTYLERLGWMARLRRGDVNQLTTLPLPHRQFPGSRIHFYMWTASLITLILSAVRWMDHGRPSHGWFADSVYLDALIGFALPVLFTLVLASYIQTRISAKFGVRSGHILPIPDPSVLLWLFSGLSTSYFIWPFGIFFIPTLPRMDARPWPDRQSLAWTSISVPLVLLLSGFVLWTLGLFLTPDSYMLSGEPYRANPPFLIELIGNVFNLSLQSTLDWGHPFLFAAAFLTLVGWLLMLPIPTFPGGRLLVARMGLDEARSSGTQILMFMLLITAAFFIFDAFNGFTVWIPVLSVTVPLLLLMGGDSRIPVLMDGDRPLSEDHHRRLGIILFIAVLFAIPPQFPVEAVERWDAEASFSLEVPEYAELNDVWSSSLEIVLDNPSMLERHYLISAEISDPSFWTASLSCESTSCDGILKPGETKTIQYNLTHPNTTHEPTSIDYQINISFDESNPSQEIGSIYPNLNATVGSEWYHVRDGEDVLSCLDVNVVDSHDVNITLPDMGPDWLPFMWFEGEAGLTQLLSSDDKTVCLDGVDQALPYNARSMLENIMLDNSSFVVGFDSTWPHIVSASSNGWLIDDNHTWGQPFEQGGTFYQENASTCTGNEFLSTPRRSNTTNWSWDLSIWPSQALPSVESGERLQLKLQADNYVHCNQEEVSETKFSVQEGPDIILYQDSQPIRLWDAPLTVDSSQIELILYNSNEDDIVLRHSSFGDKDWNLEVLPDSLSSGWNNFTIDVPPSLINTYQLSHQDGAILITFGAYLEVES